VEVIVTEVTQEDIALAALVREAQAAAAVARAKAKRGDKSMNYYQLLIALGLLFLAASFLVTHRTARIALVVLSCVAFLVAALLTVVGTAGVPGG
jgi:hypothetical protein